MKPLISVVLVAEHAPKLRLVIAHLSRQSTKADLQLILVLASEFGVDKEHLAQTFHSYRLLLHDDVSDVDKAASLAVPLADADLLAFVEDHAFPEPDWAERIIEAHRGDWSVVGSVYENANPKSSCSWANLLLAYGAWLEPFPAGPGPVSRHNICFKTRVLARLGDRLWSLLGRGGGLLSELERQGESMMVCSEATVRHLNPSRLSITCLLRWKGGRLAAATRSKNWQGWRRLLYGLASPLIPVVRLVKLWPKLRYRGTAFLAAHFPTIILALVLDGAGQMLGFLFGPGNTENELAHIESNRINHLNSHDRALFD